MKGGTYYVSVQTIADRDEWVVHVKRALECVFANPEVIPFKPSKILQNKIEVRPNSKCPKTQIQITNSNSNNCCSCFRGFSSYEYVSELSTLLQIGLLQYKI
jgi:hypothetical protein